MPANARSIRQSLEKHAENYGYGPDNRLRVHAPASVASFPWDRRCATGRSFAIAAAGVGLGLALAAGVGLLARHDVAAAAEERFGREHGPIGLRLHGVHLSRRHGVWMSFALAPARSPETAPSDLGLWYLMPLRTVAFTRDWWSDAFSR